MARLSITAFVLCALAASAAAEFNHEALQNAITLDAVLEVTSELRSEVKSLMGEAYVHSVHFSGGNFVSCATAEFGEVVILGSKLFEIANELETLANDLLNFNNCSGGIIAINKCRLGLLQEFLSSAKGLKKEVKDTIKAFKISVDKFKKCLSEGKPSTEAPAPGTEAPAPGTEAPAPGTEAPAPGTEAPAPDTEAPAPGTEAPVDPETEATSAGTEDAVTDARRVLPIRLHPRFAGMGL